MSVEKRMESCPLSCEINGKTPIDDKKKLRWLGVVPVVVVVMVVEESECALVGTWLQPSKGVC